MGLELGRWCPFVRPRPCQSKMPATNTSQNVELDGVGRGLRRSWVLYFKFSLCVCTCHGMSVEVRGQLRGVSSFLPPGEPYRPNLGLVVASLLFEPSCWVCFLFLRQCIVHPGLTLNFWSNCFSLPNSGILGLCFYTWREWQSVQWLASRFLVELLKTLEFPRTVSENSQLVKTNIQCVRVYIHRYVYVCAQALGKHLEEVAFKKNLITSYTPLPSLPLIPPSNSWSLFL